MVSKTTKPRINPDDDFGVGPSKTEISARIRESINHAGGNAVVSGKSGVSLRTISNYISGSTEPKIISLAQIAHTCDVSLDWLATGKQPAEIIEGPNMETLTAAITAAQDLFEERKFSPEQKAELIVTLYKIGLEGSSSS